MKKYILCMLFFSFLNQPLWGRNEPPIDQAALEKLNEKLGKQPVGCTCEGLKWCEGWACIIAKACLFCENSIGAIWMCKHGAMSHCSNWNEIFDNPSCKGLKNDWCNCAAQPPPVDDPICYPSSRKR